MVVVEGDTADTVWSRAARLLLDTPSLPPIPGRGGETRELLHCVLQVENPRQRWVLARRPSLNPAFALVEAIWILAGRNDSKIPNFWNSALSRFAGNGQTYHGAYGYRLRHHFGFDQLNRAFEVLRSSPQSRQVVLQIWDPQLDLPLPNGSPRSTDIPCNIGSHLLVRDGRLEWLQVMRSNDIFRGLPYNLVQFTTLQEVMAGWLGLEPGRYTHLSDSLHLYARDATSMRISEVTEPQGIDDLALPKPIADKSIHRMAERLDHLASDDLEPGDVSSLVEGGELPKPYRNMLRLAAAEAARRRGWEEEATELMATCSNPTFSSMWSAWLTRLSHNVA